MNEKVIPSLSEERDGCEGYSEPRIMIQEFPNGGGFVEHIDDGRSGFSLNPEYSRQVTREELEKLRRRFDEQAYGSQKSIER